MIEGDPIHCPLCREREEQRIETFVLSFVGETVEVILMDGRSVFGSLVAIEGDEVILRGEKNQVRYL